MADRFEAKWPVAELSAVELANGRSYLSAKEVAGLYDIAYSTFMKRVDRRLGPGTREYWSIGTHPVLGIRALNKHFYPRLIA